LFQLKGSEMDKEPQELTQARTLLKQFEKSPDEKKGMLYLVDAFTNLDEVIEGTFPQIYKDIAIRIRTTYISVVVLKVKEVMTEKKILDKDFFYWWQTINSLIDKYSENLLDPLKTQLAVKWVDGLSLQELEELESRI
jgi:hypothetical protein